MKLISFSVLFLSSFMMDEVEKKYSSKEIQGKWKLVSAESAWGIVEHDKSIMIEISSDAIRKTSKKLDELIYFQITNIRQDSMFWSYDSSTNYYKSYKIEADTKEPFNMLNDNSIIYHYFIDTLVIWDGMLDGVNYKFAKVE